MTRIDIKYLADCREVIPTIAGWIYDEWSFMYRGKTIEHVERFLRRRTNKEQLPFTLVAFRGGVPVGTVSLKKFDMETRRNLSPWVTSLYVTKQCRGKGFGARLMKALEEKSSAMKIPALFLFTIESLVPFYQKLGWNVKEEAIYHSHRIIVMEKDLTTVICANH